MVKDQHVKTNYTPKHRDYSKQIPANQQNARNVRATARKQQRVNPNQYDSPIGPVRQSASEKVGRFIQRGASNFLDNLHSPIFEPRGVRQIDTSRRKLVKGGDYGEEVLYKPPQRGKGRVGGRSDIVEAERNFMGNVSRGNYPPFGGIDLSMHPDPMVSGMYRKPREEVEEHRRKGKGGVTEIHYHYH
jgi:hypothetical protein